VTTSNKRGTATVTATTPTNVTDNGTVTVSLPPIGISLVSGGGQIGKVGALLTQLAVVRVTAADGGGVAGVTVNFAPPTGGSVGSTSVTTDAQGQASTTLTLGGLLGAQSFAASAAGFSVSIPATALVGDVASILGLSGSGLQGTILRVLAAPFVVRVTDRFGNAVSGVTVAWTRIAGAGTLAAPTSTTDANGQASMLYTLGAIPGLETVRASVAGVTTPATFTATALAAVAAAIAIVSGNNQIAQVGQLLAPLVVKVTDVDGLPVPGVPVNWSATNGTIPQSTTTDAQGLSSAPLSLGSLVGPATAIASIPTGSTTKSVTFSLTALVGDVASIVGLSGSGLQGTVLHALASPFVVRVTDRFGNPVPGATVSWTRIAGAGTLAAPTSTTDANGQASMLYTLGAIPGLETVRASVAGVTTPATFTATALAAAAAAIGIVSGNNQTGQVGQALAPLVVKVTDADGFPVPGVPVNWSATNGTIPQSTTTDAQGQTSAPLSLGSVVGPATAVASIVTGTTTKSVTFSLTALVGNAASIVAVSGSGLQGIVLRVLASPFVVRVTDSFGNPVPGATVAWSRIGGNGTLAAPTSTTDANGRSSMLYTLGALPGLETIRASVAGVATPATFTVTALLP